MAEIVFCDCSAVRWNGQGWVEDYRLMAGYRGYTEAERFISEFDETDRRAAR
jgi:hypothetical protein